MGPRRHFWTSFVSIVILTAIAMIYGLSLQEKLVKAQEEVKSLDTAAETMHTVPY